VSVLRTHIDKQTADGERRALILKAAERAFVRFGFHAATMGQVAEEAAMSPGNLYRYFPSKEAIVEGLCARNQEERVANFRSLADSPNIFEALSTSLKLHLLSCPPEKARMMLEVWAEGSRSPRIADIGRMVDRDVRAGLIEIFDAAKANGEASPAMDSLFAARLVFTLVSGLFKRLAHETNFDLEAEAEMVLGVLRGLFSGQLGPERRPESKGLI